MNNPYEDQILYYEKEILNMIYGLDRLYHSRPWYAKWYWKPFHIALNMLAIQLCSQSLENQAVIQEAEDITFNAAIE